ncbi:MAG: hydroxymethylbilane synthase [Pseudobutyrivibrio sp.]|nr:hydroxymethylbilane synthase [Pseudobutyrivibrio sp.]
MKIRIGTRGSKLALAQTNYVLEKLQNSYPDNEYETVVIKTRGDLDLTSPLDSLGAKGIFVDEIERALINNDIQIAVHSMKDMPAKPLAGLTFSKAWKREDPRDVLILRDGNSIDSLPIGAVIATGSKRRSFQLLQIRPDLNIVSIRGNIDTRLKKLKEGLEDGTQLDGIVLAAAGLNRLNLQDEITYYFPVDDMIPSPAQGTLAIEYVSSNIEMADMVNSLSDPTTDVITYLERGFLDKIGGDCHLPIGAYARVKDKGYELLALFGNEDGTALAKTSVYGDTANEELINKAVRDIKDQLKEQINE